MPDSHDTSRCELNKREPLARWVRLVRVVTNFGDPVSRRAAARMPQENEVAFAAARQFRVEPAKGTAPTAFAWREVVVAPRQVVCVRPHELPAVTRPHRFGVAPAQPVDTTVPKLCAFLAHRPPRKRRPTCATRAVQQTGYAPTQTSHSTPRDSAANGIVVRPNTIDFEIPNRSIAG